MVKGVVILILLWVILVQVYKASVRDLPLNLAVNLKLLNKEKSSFFSVYR